MDAEQITQTKLRLIMHTQVRKSAGVSSTSGSLDIIAEDADEDRIRSVRYY